MTQSDLAQKSLLTKTTVSRICRNSNDKGSSYMPDFHTVMSVCIGLSLTPDEAEELLFSAFPEMSFMKRFLNEKLTIQQANDILYDNGLSMLGNIKEE